MIKFLTTVDIKFKAERSEAIVNEICADIKTLDHANHNLSNTISVLRRLKLYSTFSFISL